MLRTWLFWAAGFEQVSQTSIQGTLRPAQLEAGAGLAQGKLARSTAQRSPSAVRFRCLGDSESEFLTCLSWRVLEISLTGARIQSCASWPSGRGIRPFVDVASIQSAPALRIARDWRCGCRASGSHGHVMGAIALPPWARPGDGARVNSWPLPWAFELIGIRDLHYHRKRDCLESTLVSTQSATKWCALARC